MPRSSFILQYWGVDPHENPATKPTFRELVRDPRWWFRDVVMALIIGGFLAAGSVIGQKIVDDQRSERDMRSTMAANRHNLQVENLRFVRDRSLETREETRRFAQLDLAGQNLVGLPLAGSDFAVANLSDANLAESDLSRANLARTNLHDAILARADLRNAYFGPERLPDTGDRTGADLTGADLDGADLTGADLSHANLEGAHLDGAILTNVYYNAETRWPKDFTPPKSRPRP